MAQPRLFQASWQQMMQDLDREELPAGVAWNMVDYIPDLQASVRKRGGWTYASPDISTVAAGATYVLAVAYADFSGGAKQVAITDNGKLATFSSTASAATAGTSTKPLQTPPQHQDKLIVTHNDGTTVPNYYDGTTIAAITAAPAGQYAAVYKDRTVIANTTAKKTYAYFSAISDPLTWDLTNAWVSTSQQITGLAALPNVLLLFMGHRTARIRGSTPPPGSDFIMDDPVFRVGCTDARSIAVDQDVCLFANPTGVYASNGTSQPEDLTAAAGLKKYWGDQLAGYSSTTWTLAGGFYRHRYYISVMNGASFVDGFCFDPAARSGYRISNLKAVGFASAQTVQEELYFASRSQPRVNAISPFFTPAASNKNDGDGTAVLPVLETGFFGSRPLKFGRRYFFFGTGRKTWRACYWEYDLRDNGDTPILTVSYIKQPYDAYTALTKTLAATTNGLRAPLWLRFNSLGVGFKVAQTNASSDTRLNGLFMEFHEREGSRV